MILFNKYPGGKKKAVTMSFDDGYREDRKLIEIFNTYGIKGTFHINSGLLYRDIRVDADEVKEIYEGHEISAHGFTHTTLSLLPQHGIVDEIMNDRRELERLSGKIIRGMSYPNGINPPHIVDTVRHCGIEYSRTTASTNTFALPQDFLLWHPTCHHLHSEDAAERFVKPGAQELGQLLCIWGHSTEFEMAGNWSLIERVSEKLANCNDIWFATCIDLYDYITASRRVRVSLDNKIIENPTNLDIWFTCDEETKCVKAGETLYL